MFWQAREATDVDVSVESILKSPQNLALHSGSSPVNAGPGSTPTYQEIEHGPASPPPAPPLGELEQGPPQRRLPQATDSISHRTSPSQPHPNIRSHYLGDSDSLSYIVEMICSSKSGGTEPVKVHYPIPAALADRTVLHDGSQARVEELARLLDSLTIPPRDVADRLIYTFFDLIHPAFPVIDRHSFARQYQQGKSSPLVLQTIFLLAFTVGDESLIHAAGFNDRSAARKTHYLGAKALYDADHETDRSNIAAVLLLLGFWWAGPDDQKDSWYWLGSATTLAQSLGMHRSYVKIIIVSLTRSLLTCAFTLAPPNLA